jgi:Alginate export
MKNRKRPLLIIILFINLTLHLNGQDTTAAKQFKEFTISAEFRPRTEYRNGYRVLRNDTSKAAFFTEQRSRIYLNYKTNRFIFHTSFQDVRVWGEDDPRATNGTIQIFETYVEPTLTKKISVRIGKQKVMFDNQRLFAQNDWRQNAGTHDAARFMYKNKKLEIDLIGAFNQEESAQERFFETDYSPSFSYYKILLANFILYKPTDKITFSMINTTDDFQDPVDKRITNYRYTNGGRVELTNKNIYLTMSGYYQHGRTAVGKPLSAYYYQPEVKYVFQNLVTFRLGAEVFSGDDATNTNPEYVKKSHSFDALYGVNHRFLGSMDYFTRFPKDLNNAGLVAPYLFIMFDANKKIQLRSDFHTFFSQNNFVVKNQVINKYLLFENDFLLTYKPNSYTELQLGYSYAITEESFEYIKPVGNSQLWQDWAYLMITFKPELFRKISEN